MTRLEYEAKLGLASLRLRPYFCWAAVMAAIWSLGMFLLMQALPRWPFPYWLPWRISPWLLLGWAIAGPAGTHLLLRVGVTRTAAGLALRCPKCQASLLRQRRYVLRVAQCRACGIDLFEDEETFTDPPGMLPDRRRGRQINQDDSPAACLFIALLLGMLAVSMRPAAIVFLEKCTASAPIAGIVQSVRTIDLPNGKRHLQLVLVGTKDWLTFYQENLPPNTLLTADLRPGDCVQVRTTWLHIPSGGELTELRKGSEVLLPLGAATRWASRRSGRRESLVVAGVGLLVAALGLIQRVRQGGWFHRSR